MASVPEKMKERYTEGGIRGLAESFFNRTRRLFSTYVYFNRKARVLTWSLDDPLPEVEPPTVDIEIRELRGEEIEHFEDIIREEKVALWRRRLEEGKVALIAWHEGKVAWYGWVSMQFEHEPVFDVELQLEHDEGYVLDAYTRPEYRGSNLHTYMSVKRLERLKQMGARRAVGIAARHNVASRKAHHKGGAVEVKEISHINILGIKFHRWKDLETKE
jgi:GNAT superfamily N-acetyltransferase